MSAPVVPRSHPAILPRAALPVRLSALHERWRLLRGVEQVHLRLHSHELHRTYLRQSEFSRKLLTVDLMKQAPSVTATVPGVVSVPDATTLTFNGSQHMLISVPEESRTQTEDVTLRFRTTRPLGLLLTTSTEQSADRLELAVAGGRVRLTVRLGDKEKVLVAGQGLNDNQWHTLQFSRRGSGLKLQVDDDTPARGERTTYLLDTRLTDMSAYSPVWGQY
ncbi:unnamed protein product [Timema podura]|uniref:Laminin G domain-containing protein n=1 Tax=Timema podura TaxID=61482 RepID=A0ABN7PC16_TIMPD|nr:unnamed protein product [Timema podura]